MAMMPWHQAYLFPRVFNSIAMVLQSIRIPADREGPNRRRRLLVCAVAASPWLARSTEAIDAAKYPNRPIRIVLPSTVGGTSDLIARLFAARLEEGLGQPVVIEARPGAAGRIAVDRVAGAAPDGYTLLLANNGANAIVPADRKATAMHAGKTLAPVTMLARLPIVIAVTPALGVDTLPDLIARARGAAAATLFYASSGDGSTSHLAADLLCRRAGIRMVHIPYAGTSAAVKDVLSGEVPVLFTHLGTVAGLIHAGQLRALAVTGDHRMTEFPDLKTVAEMGYPGFDVTTWHGVMAPANTPYPVIARLYVELVRAVGIPEVQSQLAAMGMEPVGSTPEQFSDAINADVRRWAEVLRATGRANE
jgi:tripartite-type tricarboxylate transporter receptor subunit TctC